MRNFGDPQQHREAFEHYVEVGDQPGHALTGANFMLERFVAIGETQGRAQENLGRLARAFGRFIALYADGGRRPLPTTDGELLVDHAGPGDGRPAIAIAGTPAEIAENLGRTRRRPGLAGCWSKRSRARRCDCSLRRSCQRWVSSSWHDGS